MKRVHFQTIGIILSCMYGLFVVFVYALEPRSLDDLSTKTRDVIATTVNTGQILTGTYQVDKDSFANGLAAFRADSFAAAREFFVKADPAGRDAETQFYIAYSFYRQGWGRFVNDDKLFQLGLEKVKHLKALDPSFVSSDSNLVIKTAGELQSELEQGIEVSADDFNPLRIARQRK